MFVTIIIDYFQLWFLYKIEFYISTAGKHVGTININTLNLEYQQYLPHHWSDKGFKRTESDNDIAIFSMLGALKITLTVPLKGL